IFFFFFSSRRRHTRSKRDWSSDVCSSDLECPDAPPTTCLLFGDSYTYPLIKFVAESFGRLVFAHSANVDRHLVEEVAPDVVVTRSEERRVGKECSGRWLPDQLERGRDT